MSGVKIGILREGRIPIDRRVPLLPKQCAWIRDEYGVEVLVQPSDIRCFSNKEYIDEGLSLSEDLSSCDILIGIKEVPLHLLIPNKTYLFFSHTIKKQPHNRKLLQTVLEKNIRLIDYECLTDGGNRVIAFGRFAGLVGAYNALLIYGKKYNTYDLKRAYQCYDLKELKRQLENVALPPIKIAVTGSGRVAGGAMEILNFLGIKKISPTDYLHTMPDEPVYAQFGSMSYHDRKDGNQKSPEDFYKHPEEYQSTFIQYAQKSDIFIAASYWNPRAPALFTKKDMRSENFKLKVIADITCDMEGSIPSTIKPTTIYDPVYDYDPYEEAVEAPYTRKESITVMAIDNLPGELPRDASEDFGLQLIQKIIPALFKLKESDIIERATITKHGKLTPPFLYLEDYVN